MGKKGRKGHLVKQWGFITTQDFFFSSFFFLTESLLICSQLVFSPLSLFLTSKRQKIKPQKQDCTSHR